MLEGMSLNEANRILDWAKSVMIQSAVISKTAKVRVVGESALWKA